MKPPSTPVPFPKLSEKCEKHVCLIDNPHGDEKWEDVFGIDANTKNRDCVQNRTALEELYNNATQQAIANSLGSYLGQYRLRKGRSGWERRTCCIDARGIFVSMSEHSARIVTSFRPILKSRLFPPRTAAEFKRNALDYYRQLASSVWGT